MYSRSEHDADAPVVVREVEEVFTRFAAVLELTVAGEVIRTTGEHPFWADRAERGLGWAKACELAAGDRLLSASGEWLAVEAVAQTESWEAVYNCRVAEDHTYFVGRDEWGFSLWAHNAYIMLRRYAVQGNDPPETRHWSVEINDSQGCLNSDQRNDGGAPTGNTNLVEWEKWKPKAWIRLIPGKGPLRNFSISGEARIEITEAQAMAARAKVQEQVARGKYRYDLYSDSCFVYVARVLHAAGIHAAPLPPSNRDQARQLLDRLNEILSGGDD